MNVFPFALKDEMPLVSCLECFSSEYSFLVLTLVGLVRSSVSGFIPRISPMYLSDIRRTTFLYSKNFLRSVGLLDLVQRL